MLTLDHITKTFGATRAVEDVSLRVGRGEIVAIVGENGAGKTTLMRIVAGETAPDHGTIRLEGRVSLVHQHFMLVSNFTIAENLALAGIAGRRTLLHTRASLRSNADAIIAASGIDLRDSSRLVGDLSVGERSKLELIKAIGRKPDILILDEPTSVLTPGETDELFHVIRELAASGTAVVFISHKLREVLAIAQRLVVMRGGRVVAETTAHGMTVAALAEAMIGERKLPGDVAAGAAIGAPVELRAAGSGERQRDAVTASMALSCEEVVAERLAGITFHVSAGEIVAIVGVAGNGQAELAAGHRGIVPPRSGRILLGGREVTRADLRRSHEVGHIPEDRTRDGLIPQMSVAENIALTSRRWKRSQALRLAERLISLYSIRARGASQAAGSLSGGNQQKVILARELDRRPSCIVAAEPTRGLDIAATQFVHSQLRAAAGAGSGILLMTSDLDEAFALAGAVHVIYRGRLSERLTPEDAANRVGSLMAGVA